MNGKGKKKELSVGFSETKLLLFKQIIYISEEFYSFISKSEVNTFFKTLERKWLKITVNQLEKMLTYYLNSLKEKLIRKIRNK